MLSAFIQSEHSYPALPLVEQLVYQRSVRFGPLVTYSPITRSVDYIFTHSAFATELGWRRITYMYLSAKISGLSNDI